MIKILWADDEIDLLKPHIIYLEGKGYDLTSAKSGDEALEILEENKFDLIFLDENMPGLTGLETLTIIKEKHANIMKAMKGLQRIPFSFDNGGSKIVFSDQTRD